MSNGYGEATLFDLNLQKVDGLELLERTWNDPRGKTSEACVVEK